MFCSRKASYMHFYTKIDNPCKTVNSVQMLFANFEIINTYNKFSRYHKDNNYKLY